MEVKMKRVFILKGLDCPNCSAKIEKEVGELDGVTSSTVNLMNQTLTVQAGTSVAASLLDTVTTIVHSHEPDVEVSEKQLEATAPVKKDEKAAVYNDEDKKRTIRLAVGAVVYAIGMALTVFAKTADSGGTGVSDCGVCDSWLGCRMAGSEKISPEDRCLTSIS